MKSSSFYLFIYFVLLFYYPAQSQTSGKNVSFKHAVKLFDGKSFTGWEGDTINTWRIENGAIAGGSFEETVPHNFFLATKKSYSNFILKLKFKLISKEGFVNAGVQFRSERLADPVYEMKGYQADLGPKYWASLYDESRRNVTLVSPDSLLVRKILKPEAWNEYEVRANKNRIEIFLNGVQTVSYIEKDSSIPQSGIIGLQIHGGGKTVVFYKNIFIEELH